jgi:hypothetical protein
MTVYYGGNLRFLLTTTLLLLLFWAGTTARSQEGESTIPAQPPQRRSLSPPLLHTSNYAVIVSSSRYWFNYRHAANALSIYQLLRWYGFSNENIILMIADEYAVNPRNPAKNKMYNTAATTTTTTKGARRKRSSLHTDDIEIDYRGEDVVSGFFAVICGCGCCIECVDGVNLSLMDYYWILGCWIVFHGFFVSTFINVVSRRWPILLQF